MQHPRETRQTQQGHNIPLREEQHDHDIPRGVETEAESTRARGHGPQLAPTEEGNGAMLGAHVVNEELYHPQPGAEEQSWERRFRSLQQELSRMKEVVKGRTSDTMDTLVQQTESPFKAEVLRHLLPAKFRMPQVEAFDGVKDPVDHLNTYKNQMELHGYQDPVRCRAFATTLKGPALAWFNRLPPSSIPSFKDLSIAFVSHFIGARTYRKPRYPLLTVKQGTQESLKSYVQRFNAESLKVDVPDEKFATIAFIVGLGIQSKDLMFSISKNPQASMAEVLAKAEKYINGEEAFTALKTYLSSPPILVSPIEGELLTLYLAVSDFSTSAVLVRDKGRVQHPVYYCSRALRGAEERYPRMEKLILALMTAAWKLRPYFQAHTIEVPTEYSMKQVLHKPETSGRLMKWAIELSEFDIRYKPKTAIKGQILADFVMEFTSAEPAEKAQTETNPSIW